MLPFSILDNIPAEMPAATPSSVTVNSSDLRNRRTSNPTLDFNVRTAASLGALELVRLTIMLTVSFRERRDTGGRAFSHLSSWCHWTFESGTTAQRGGARTMRCSVTFLIGSWLESNRA